MSRREEQAARLQAAVERKYGKGAGLMLIDPRHFTIEQLAEIAAAAERLEAAAKEQG